jgi:hypothetical protein
MHLPSELRRNHKWKSADKDGVGEDANPNSHAI